MACRRCSQCNIDYPTDVKDSDDSCDGCGGGLSYFSTVAPDADWLERVEGVVWSRDKGWNPLFGGVTAMTRFVDSSECGDYAPEGNDA